MIADYFPAQAIAPQRRRPVTQTIKYDPDTGEEEVTIKGSSRDLSAANPYTPTLIAPDNWQQLSQAAQQPESQQVYQPIEYTQAAMGQQAFQPIQYAQAPATTMTDAAPQIARPTAGGHLQPPPAQAAVSATTPSSIAAPAAAQQDALNALQTGDYKTAGQYALTDPQIAGAVKFDANQRASNEQTINQRYQELEKQTSTPDGRVKLEQLIKQATKTGEGGVLDWVKSFALYKSGFREQANKIANDLLGFGINYEIVKDPKTGESTLIGRNSQGLPVIGIDSAGQQVSVENLIKTSGLAAESKAEIALGQAYYDPSPKDSEGHVPGTWYARKRGGQVELVNTKGDVATPEQVDRITGVRSVKGDIQQQVSDIKARQDAIREGKIADIPVEGATAAQKAAGQVYGTATQEGFKPAAPINHADVLLGGSGARSGFNAAGAGTPVTKPVVPQTPGAQTQAEQTAAAQTIAAQTAAQATAAPVAAQTAAGGQAAQRLAAAGGPNLAPVAPTPPPAAPADGSVPLYQQRQRAEAESAAARAQAESLARLPAVQQTKNIESNARAITELNTKTASNGAYIVAIDELADLAARKPQLFGINNRALKLFYEAKTDEAERDALARMIKGGFAKPEDLVDLERARDLSSSIGVYGITSSGLPASALNSDNESRRIVAAVQPQLTDTPQGIRAKLIASRASLEWVNGLRDYMSQLPDEARRAKDEAAHRLDYDRTQGRAIWAKAQEDIKAVTRKPGSSSAAASTTQPYSDTEKEARYQAWKKAQGR